MQDKRESVLQSAAGDWYQVTLSNGDTGWIAATYAARVDGQSTASTTAAPTADPAARSEGEVTAYRRFVMETT